MKRSILGILLGLLFSAGGILIAANTIKEPLKVVAIWPIALAVAVMVLAWLVQGTVLAVLNRREIQGLPKFRNLFKGLPIVQTTRVYLATQAVGGITPFGGGEIAYQLLELKRLGVPADVGGAAITIKGMFNFLTLLIGATVGVLVVSEVPFVGGWQGLPFSQNQILLVAAAAIIVVWVVALWLWRRRRSSGGEEEDAEKPGWRQRLRGFLHDYWKDLALFWRHDPWAMAACFGLMAVYWVLYPLIGTLALRAAGWDGSGWVAVFLAQYVLFMIIPIAPTPGNSGAAEVVFTALMGAYVPHSALLGGVLIWRALNHYAELIVGAFLAGGSAWEDVEVAKREFRSG